MYSKTGVTALAIKKSSKTPQSLWRRHLRSQQGKCEEPETNTLIDCWEHSGIRYHAFSRQQLCKPCRVDDLSPNSIRIEGSRAVKRSIPHARELASCIRTLFFVNSTGRLMTVKKSENGFYQKENMIPKNHETNKQFTIPPFSYRVRNHETFALQKNGIDRANW